MPPILIVLLVVVIVVAVLATILKNRRGTAAPTEEEVDDGARLDVSGYVKRPYLFTSAEFAFFKVLRPVVGDRCKGYVHGPIRSPQSWRSRCMQQVAAGPSGGQQLQELVARNFCQQRMPVYAAECRILLARQPAEHD